MKHALNRKETMRLQLLASTDKSAALALVLDMLAGKKPPEVHRVIYQVSPHPIEGPSPCDGCEFSQRCQSHHLACGRFVRFVGGQNWSSVKPVPRKHVYMALFGP